MYIVSLNYIQPLEQVDMLINQHIEWLERNYQLGYFMVSGRKQPRTGGVILVNSMPKQQLEQILQQDPFQVVAKYSITEVHFSKVQTDLVALKE
ncbi:YciI family protein [Acinetobacter sp. HY1485]|uniref:YciI family protein n=1 Tax=Acinetobacter sp. HY1485 TaxID=2970918 RepID=UPI0022B9C216|nr:YciI family protein [Acinetobacter sp. HY1485]